MSSMRNAVQRRNHRERAQPEERQKWGLLEKHKDYSLRAKDHAIKKTKLRSLRQKALDKNPDEFYFGMLSSKGPSTTGKNRTGTVDGGRGNKVMGQETVRLLKTQDMGYLRTVGNRVRKEVEELEERVKAVGGGKGRKVVWVEDVEEQEGRLAEGDEEGEGEVDLEERKLKKMQGKEAEKLENKLAIARERLKAITDAEEALDLQRAKMAKSPSVGGVNKHGVKYKVRGRKR